MSWPPRRFPWRMTPYESHLRGWARSAGIRDFLGDSHSHIRGKMWQMFIEFDATEAECLAILRRAGELQQFYRAFPDYDPDYEGPYWDYPMRRGKSLRGRLNEDE